MSKRTAALLLTALLALGGSACGDPEGGGRGNGGDALNALAAAADAASDAGSSRMEMSMIMDAGQKITVDAEGIFDFEEQIGSMEMTFEAEGFPVPGGDEPTQMIVEGHYAYMKGALATAGYGAGEGWVRLDLSSMPGVGAGQFNQDPTQYIEFLRGAGADIEELGSEEVRGTPTTHYSADVDVDKVLEQAADPEEMEAIKEQLEASGIETIPTEVWIDDDGLPRRMEMTMEMKGGESLPQDITMTITMDLFDYGVDVNVTPPKDFQEISPPAG